MENLDSYDSSDHLDIEKIHQLQKDLVENPEQTVVQLGKYGITIGQGSDIHIGDKINQSLDKDSLDALTKTIRNAVRENEKILYQHLKRQPLEILKLDAHQVETINFNLGRIDFLEKKGYLDASQINTFTTLKQEVKFLNEQNRKLDQLHSAAKSLLEENKVNLKTKIEELKSQGQKILDPDSLGQITQERKCKESELEIIENFIQELEESGEIAVWLEKARRALSKRFGREALQAFPEIEENISPDQVSYFCFSIYQFLEQIAHCLKWGRHNILASTDIPLVVS